MKVDASSFDSLTALLLIIAAALGIYGLLNNLLFVSGAFLIAGAALMRYKHQRVVGIVASSFGIVFFAFVFSYGVGKDMALRDNALSKPACSAPSAAL